MKKLFQWVMAAALTCGSTVFTACSDSGDNPSPEPAKKNRKEFIEHTRANLKELAENLNFSSWTGLNHLNKDFNTNVLTNPSFDKTISTAFSLEILKSIKPVEEGSELAQRGYQAYAIVDFTNFNYRFTQNADNTGFDMEQAEDFQLVFKRTKPQGDMRPEGEERPEGDHPMNETECLVLKALGSSVDMIDTRVSTDALAVIMRIPTVFEFNLGMMMEDGTINSRLKGTFNYDIVSRGTSSFKNLRTDAWTISGTLDSQIKVANEGERPQGGEAPQGGERPQGGEAPQGGERPQGPNGGKMKDDATTITFSFGQDPTTKKANLKFGFIHNGRNIMNLNGVMKNLNGQTDYSQFNTSMSMAEAFTAIMAGNSLEEGTITLLDDLTTTLKVSDCQKVVQLQNAMASARRNYADQQTIEGYTQQLNQLVSASMTCKGLGQQIPMKLQTIKFGVDYWTVPALNFADENGYVPLTDMLDTESIEYMINIVDHAAEPMQDAIVTVRQLMQYLQTLMGTIQKKNQSGVGDAVGIAMIAKNKNIDYWRQIETSFRSACQEKGLVAYHYATSAGNAYQEQVSAVAELRNLDSKALKGIIFTPCYGQNGESAEAEVAAFAQERGIPVVILDSPVSASSPLASYPYIGTNNTAAGQAMAEKVTADKVAVFATINSPGIERAKAFKALKPNAVVYSVGDEAKKEVQAVLDEYDDFVFFNGSNLVDVLGMLKAAGKRVYTFDVYDDFINELIMGSATIKGIMAQNTFGMARKAVDAVLANAKQGEMVPTFYITEDNLGDANVKPFLEFYNIPAAIDNLAEKILGKWIESEVDGKPALSTDKSVTTFVSATKAIYSSSKDDFTETQRKWSDHRAYDVKISGNKVTLKGHPESNSNLTLLEEYFISSVTATEIVCKFRHTTIREDQEVGGVTEKNIRLTKTDIDYSKDIVGTWEGKTSEGLNVRWNIKADGTYEYSRNVGDGNWEKMIDEFNEYFADGYMFCARWKNAGDGKGEQRQWWEVESIQNDVMKWKTLRQNADGTTFTITAEMTKVK